MTAAGAIVIFMGAFLTVIAAKRFEAQERAHSTILSTALHNMSNGLLFIDQHRRVGLFNDRYLEMFAVTREQEGEHYEDGNRLMTLASFYDEYTMAPEDRALPAEQIEVDDATAPFREWTTRHGS